MNLLEETIKCLEENGKTPQDVEWVGTSKGWGTWEEFVALANINYENLPKFVDSWVDSSLLVVGAYFWMEREFDDSSEWWRFCTAPIRSTRRGLPPKLI